MEQLASRPVKRGGRVVGTRNKRTVRDAQFAERQMQQALREGRKLAKDQLEEIASIFRGAAAYFQPTTEQMIAAAAAQGKQLTPNPHGNWEQFGRWLDRAVHALEAYAKYQSPQLRAVSITTPVVEEADDVGTYAAHERLRALITRRVVADEIELEAQEAASESSSRQGAE